MHSTLKGKVNKKNTCLVNLNSLTVNMSNHVVSDIKNSGPRRSSRSSSFDSGYYSTSAQETAALKKVNNSKKKNVKKPSYKQIRATVDLTKSEYIVEDIRNVYLVRRKLQFEVKWLYWSNNYNSIEPMCNLNCPAALRSFLQAETAKYGGHIRRLINTLAIGPLFTDKTLQKMIPLQGVSYNAVLLQSYLLALLDIPSYNRSPTVLQKVRELLQKRIFLEKRQKQKKALLDWEKKINLVDSKGKVRIVNDVDFEGPPQHFTYIDKNILTDNIYFEESGLACSCNPCSYKSNCCGKLHGSEYAYTCKGRLKQTGVYLMECNKNCKCGPDCNNRVVQRGRSNKLCLFRTSNDCGWGVKTDRAIKSGDFVCEYVGEVIKSDVAEQRGLQYDKMGVTYLFDIDQIVKGSEAYTIDAFKYGNISHFINHSCEPNLCVVNVWVDRLHPNLSRLALFACENINKDEELTIDYKFSSNVQEPSQVDTSQEAFLESFGYSMEDAINEDRPNSPEAGSSAQSPAGPAPKYMICKCGAKSCRKFLQYC